MITTNTTSLKYTIDTPENRQFLSEIRDTLFSFGRQFSSPGGGSYYLGDDGTPLKDRPRETWITSRMAHVYSIASLLEPASDYGLLADAALQGLCGELHDRSNGGWYAGLQADGTPLPTKQCYAHAFVILAACSGVLAKRPASQSLLEEALATYDKYFWNETEGLSCDTWNTEFTILDDYRGLNANMHTVEAFLAVADATSNEPTAGRQDALLIMFLHGLTIMTGVSRNIFEKTGHWIWTVTRIIRTIRSNPMVQHRVMVSNGQD